MLICVKPNLKRECDKARRCVCVLPLGLVTGALAQLVAQSVCFVVLAVHCTQPEERTCAEQLQQRARTAYQPAEGAPTWWQGSHLPSTALSCHCCCRR